MTLTLDSTLNSIIDDSLIHFPRKYILSLIRDGNKPIGKQLFERLLTSCFTDKHVTLDSLRSAYITDKYNSKQFTMRQKEELAKKMRHSVNVASQIYHKIVVPEEELVNEEPKNDDDSNTIDFIRNKLLKYLNFAIHKKQTSRPANGAVLNFQFSFNGIEWV